MTISKTYFRGPPIFRKSFLVLPLFALANSGLALRELDMSAAIRHPVTLGVIFGLVFGKPLGIISLTYLGSKLLQAPLMRGIKWSHIIGVSLLGGIGFTMSLFISGLSFTSNQALDFSKLGILHDYHHRCWTVYIWFSRTWRNRLFNINGDGIVVGSHNLAGQEILNSVLILKG